ncbi:MAG: ATP synthase F0 subunit C [Elusimicrobia bacterium]|nr:ATP synthase F0 subunit C [Elusimicrobiota bacterium]
MWHLALGYVGTGIGVGLVVIGAAFGIARLASAALEGAARQPEAAGSLQTMMIIPAAMIEGLGLLAVVAVLLGILALNKGGPAAEAGAETHAAASH